MKYSGDEAVKNGILDEEELRWAREAGLDIEVSDVWRLDVEQPMLIIKESTGEIKIC